MTDAILVGKGPKKIIALHGWFGSAAAWEPFFGAIDPQRYSYAFIDYRGYGKRKNATGAFTIDEIATDALALADELGWQRFSLVGHSMGGKAAQRVHVKAPQRVEALVGISPVPATGVPFDEGSWNFFSSAAGDVGVRAAIIDNTTGQRLSKYWSRTLAERSWGESTQAAFAAYLLAWAKDDFSGEVKDNGLAVKVIVGEHDPALSADVMRGTYLAWYKKAELEIMPNAGHYAPDETPVALASSLEKFFA
jgi:pimeloyl-ACP methyl ester carboxylesterase